MGLFDDGGILTRRIGVPQNTPGTRRLLRAFDRVPLSVGVTNQLRIADLDSGSGRMIHELHQIGSEPCVADRLIFKVHVQRDIVRSPTYHRHACHGWRGEPPAGPDSPCVPRRGRLLRRNNLDVVSEGDWRCLRPHDPILARCARRGHRSSPEASVLGAPQ